MEKLQRPARSASAERRNRQDAPANLSRPASRERRGQTTPSGSSVSTTTSFSVGGNNAVEEEVPTAKLHVVCRVRPMSEHEKRSGTVPCVTASTERSEVVVVRSQTETGKRQVRSTFNFDSVLTSFSTQSDVFAVTLKPLIREVLCGYEAAAFAYGQTGTGKTYTMEGNLDSEDDMGLVPRASAAVFQAVMVGNYISSTITASCLEIYNENLTDLLSQQDQQVQKLDLKEALQGITCHGLSEMSVSSADDVQELVCLAQDRRRIAETRINAKSSRSHTIFTLRVTCRKRVQNGEVENIGKLHLVDLAGSECAKKASMHEMVRSGTSSIEAERERRNINQSLLTLGRVIAALRDESSRVPYRDSKLTRLLQDALGGSCRTVMIATISPALGAVDETISTLAYAEQAMGIQNRPVAASTLIVRAPSGDLNSAHMGGVIPTAANMRCEGSEIEMKLNYLTQEVEECQAALARKIRESEDLSREVQQAEAKYASAAAELEEQRLAVAERDFILQRTTDFADRRVESARCLAAALESSNGRGSALEDGLRRSNTLAASVRQQARNLHATAAEHLDALAAAGGVARAENVVEAASAASSAWREPLHALREVFEEQQSLLDSLIGDVRGSGKQLSEVLACACVTANKAACTEHAANSERIAIIDTATSTAASASANSSMAANETLLQQEAALLEQVERLNAMAVSSTRALTDAASTAGHDLEVARLAAAASQKADDDQLGRTICDAITCLGTEMRGLHSESERHAESLVTVRSQAADNSLDSAARRTSMREVIQRTGVTHAGAVAATSPPLCSSLEQLAQKLSTRHSQVAENLGSASAQLSDVRSRMSEAATTSQTAIDSSLTAAGEHLTGAWEDIECGFASLISSLKGPAVEKNACALASFLIAAASALDASREDSTREISELRQQRQAEERLVSLVLLQREELQADIARMQSMLDDLSSEVQTAQKALQSTEEDQARRREETLQSVLGGVETLLRGGMEGMGRSLKERADTVRFNLSQASANCKASGTLAKSAQERVTARGDAVSQVAKSWALGTDTACDRIAAANEACLQASRQVHSAATEKVGDLVSVVEHLRETQDAVQPKWEASRDATAAAASSWGEKEKAAICSLEEVASKNESALEEGAALRTEVSAHCAEAQAQVDERSREDEHHTALLADLSQLHADCSKQEDAAETHHLGVLSTLVEHALAVAKAAALRVPEAERVLEAVRSQAAAATAAAEAHSRAMEATVVKIKDLVPQAEEANKSIAQHVDQIQASAVEAYREAAQSASTTAVEVTESLKSATSAVEAQRTASVAANAAREGRWLELERSHAGVLKAVEAASAATCAESSILKSRSEVRTEEERADTAHRRVSAQIEEHRTQLKDALAENQNLWQRGLSCNPMRAFTGDEIFEDELACELPATIAPLPPRILEDLATHRPNAQALSGEFHASRTQKSDLHRGVAKEDEAPLSARSRTSSSKSMGKQSLEEATGYPRMALRELQVGGAPSM